MVASSQCDCIGEANHIFGRVSFPVHKANCWRYRTSVQGSFAKYKHTLTINPMTDAQMNSKVDADTTIVDPDGDLVFVFDPKNNASKTEAGDSSSDTSGSDTSSVDPSSKTEAGDSSSDSPGSDTSPVDPSSKTKVGDSSSDSPGSDTSPVDPSSERSNSDKPSTMEPNKIRFVVSSKHMSLASPVFKAMLRGNFQESSKLKETCRIEIPLPDDDPNAWKILVNIIHGRYKSIPLQLELEVLTQIAVLVDKYRMHEVVYLFIPTWRKAIQYPPIQWKATIRWICISWVFDLPDEFQELTKKIQLECPKSFEELLRRCNLNALPIPQLVVDKLEASRLKALGNAFEILGKTILQYQNDIPNCKCDLNLDSLADGRDSHQRWCDMLVHESLVRSATKESIFPIPKAPYDRHSFSSLHSKIKNLEIVTACYIVSRDNVQRHQIHQSLVESIDAVGKNFVGLQLASLKKDSIQAQCPTQ